jgi:Cu/Ag efflux protein CusF
MRSLVFSLALALAACSTEKQPAQQGEVEKFAIHGQIVELDPKDKLATIKHENIEGFMKAMTMVFPVKDEKEFAALKVGEVIDGTVYKQKESLDYWIADIHSVETNAVETK